MKRVSLFMMAAIVAASSVFVSCSKDPDPYIEKDGPNISVTFGGAAVTGNVDVQISNESKDLVISYSAPGGIKTITLTIDGATKTVDFEVDGASASFTESISLNLAQAKAIAVTTQITDNQAAASDGLPDAITDKNESFSFTINVKENALSAAEEFVLTHPSENVTVGIKWESVLGSSPFRGHFRVVTTGSKFVMLTEDEFKAITTKEVLKKKYDDNLATKGVDFFDVNETPQASFKPTHFISKVGDTYFLVVNTYFHLGNASATPPIPREAKFSYQK